MIDSSDFTLAKILLHIGYPTAEKSFLFRLYAHNYFINVLFSCPDVLASLYVTSWLLLFGRADAVTEKRIHTQYPGPSERSYQESNQLFKSQLDFP